MSINIKIYNSLTNQIEDFKPIIENKLSMYVCGPTVYNHIHIGNGRPLVFFDFVARFFKYIGYDVNYISNFTDIDDKIIKKAKEESKTEEEISTYYIEQYLDNSRKLHCVEIEHVKVTENIEEIISFIEKLVKNDFAYASGDDVYFRVKSIKNYGILSNQKIDDLENGSRISINTNKEDPRDFTLWKKTTDAGLKWNTPFGLGRPGWHTECVVMINNFLGKKIDIHGGGIDIKFPHHENEIAQSIALNDNTIANYWVHNARLDLDGEKMSKSLGNVIWLKDLLNKYDPNIYRLLIFTNHYRQTINYSDLLINQMVLENNKIKNAYISLFRKIEVNYGFKKIDVQNEMNEFLNYCAMDFQTPNAITVLQDLIKKINKDLRSKDTQQDTYYKDFQMLTDMLYIFGLVYDINPLNDDEISLVKDWELARVNKDYQLADELRSKINNLGILL